MTKEQREELRRAREARDLGDYTPHPEYRKRARVKEMQEKRDENRRARHRKYTPVACVECGKPMRSASKTPTCNGCRSELGMPVYGAPSGSMEARLGPQGPRHKPRVID
jgi:hypothetical protein